MAIQKHVHKLKRHKYKTGVMMFFCTLNCDYRIEAPFALGKQSLCNICFNPFTMTEYALKLVRPHCSACGRKEVKDSNGKKHYITRVQNQTVLSSSFQNAEDTTADLRSRLSAITLPPQKAQDQVADEDL